MRRRRAPHAALVRKSQNGRAFFVAAEERVDQPSLPSSCAGIIPSTIICSVVSREPVDRLTESSSHQTALYASQSTIFVFSSENSKTAHAFAHILLARSPERLRFGLQQPDSARFSLARTETVPFDHRLATALARTSPFIELCQFQ